MFASQSQEKVDAAISRFKQRCSWVGATIGSTCETARKIEHRGLIYDLANNTRALKPSWLEKLIDRVNLTLRRPTAARLWSLGGMLNWARPLCSAIDELTVVWKLVARSAAKTSTTPVTIPQECAQQLQSILKVLLTVAPQPLRQDQIPNKRVLVISDAAREGPFASWAYVIAFPDKDIRVASGMFPYNTTTHINVLEMKATLMALQHVTSVVSEPIHVVCYTDNQVSERILAKGRTASIAISAVLKQVKEVVRASHLHLAVAWIPSAQNPADAPSRGQPMTARDTESVSLLARMDAPVSMRSSTFGSGILGSGNWRSNALTGLQSMIRRGQERVENWNSPCSVM